MQKHTLVIGGTRGLGKVVVKLLSEEGHAISILARNIPSDIEPSNKHLFYAKADLEHYDAFLKTLSSIVETRGKINYLIFLQRYRDNEDCWIGELEITLQATRKTIDYIKSERMFANDDAAIVMVSSIAGKFATEDQPLSYSVAKAGLNQMVQHYAAELGPTGVRVNAVSPCSFIKEESQQFYLDNKKLSELYQKIVPLRRMCKAEDVANVISFLCSHKAAFVSGQNITVDGGLSIINHESLARKVGMIQIF